MIDLHAHTTASDGRLSPTELVARAKAARITTLAITDHDTLAGIAEAQEAARALGGIAIVPGIEISTSVAGADIHVLGHFVRPDDPALVAFTETQRGERRARMERMVAKLVAMGIPVEMAQVEAVAHRREGDVENLCRPHLAQVLVDRGVAADFRDAFARYLGDDAPAFSPHRTPDAAEAIRLIHDAGGTATLAHPASDGIERPALASLAALGLDGVEVFRAEEPIVSPQKYLQFARELGLVPTAGSDFHGEGGGLGTVSLDPRAFEALRDRARA